MRARADVRARPVSLILVTILVGLIGALAITALSASRRTDSAYTRFRAEWHKKKPDKPHY